MSICPSAQPDVDVAAIVSEFCDNDFYKEDYQSITNYFVADYVSYQDAIMNLRQLMEGESFNK